MYDISTKKVRKGLPFFGVFFVVGVFVGALLIYLMIGQAIANGNRNKHVTSTSVEIEEVYGDNSDVYYKPVYVYTVGGERYTCRDGSAYSMRPSVENQTIYYEESNPSNCSINTSDALGSRTALIFIFIFLPGLFITISTVNIIKIFKRIKIIKQLNKTGKLVKNLPYHLAETGIEIGNSTIFKMVVDYHLPDGHTVHLEGDPIYNGQTDDADGLVDLVIDEENPEKHYYLDFEINRLEGNRKDDYYVDPNA
jgi:hypothetical protein